MALGWGFGIDKVLARFDRDEAAGTWRVLYQFPVPLRSWVEERPDETGPTDGGG
eukprot:gene55907-45824_t